MRRRAAKLSGNRWDRELTPGSVGAQNTLVSMHKSFSGDHTQTLNTVIHFSEQKTSGTANPLI